MAEINHGILSLESVHPIIINLSFTSGHLRKPKETNHLQSGFGPIQRHSKLNEQSVEYQYSRRI